MVPQSIRSILKATPPPHKAAAPPHLKGVCGGYVGAMWGVNVFPKRFGNARIARVSCMVFLLMWGMWGIVGVVLKKRFVPGQPVGHADDDGAAGLLTGRHGVPVPSKVRARPLRAPRDGAQATLARSRGRWPRPNPAARRAPPHPAALGRMRPPMTTTTTTTAQLGSPGRHGVPVPFKVRARTLRAPRDGAQATLARSRGRGLRARGTTGQEGQAFKRRAAESCKPWNRYGSSC